MPKHRRMKLMEESNGACGEEPEYGAIFMSSSSTRKECLSREIFGLPIGQAGFVKQVKAGMVLFLFEFESRELHGVFQACSDGAINIEPNAFCSSGKQFPAQVKFTEMWHCRPLREVEFRHAISDNYFAAKKFNFGLSEAQVQRLLKLFSLKKVERLRPRNTEVAKPTRESASSLGNTAGDRDFGNRGAEDADGDVDREFRYRVTSAGNRLGRRLKENHGFGSESDIGLETKGNRYSGDTSGVYRRLVDPKLHESVDRVGCDFSMNNSFGTDALTNHSDYNDRRVSKDLRNTASGWSENEYHEKDGITQAGLWSSHEECLDFGANPSVPAQSSVPRGSRYGTNTECYDPCDPGILGNATMISSRQSIGAPNVDSVGSASFTANSNHVLREDFIAVGGFVSDTSLPSKRVQPFYDEHNDTSMNKTSSLGVDYYIPMPTEHLGYQTKFGVIGVAGSESEYESRNGHLRHYQFPDLLTSSGATENVRNFERPSYSSRSIVPSFAYPSSSRDLSPKDGVNNETSAYQSPEKRGGHLSYPYDRAVRDSRVYPSFTYPSTSGDGADMYSENRSQNQVQAYQHHEEFGGDAFDSNKRVVRMKEQERVSPAELERNRTRTRKSVFSRLAMPSERHDAEQDTSPKSESVDEVMAFLKDCHEHWMEQKGPIKSNPEDFGKPKKKREKIRTAEVLDNDVMLPFTETAPDDLLDHEESMEHSGQKRTFIDFKRRSKAQTSPGNPSQGSEDSPNHPAPQDKRRKLLRPKLIEDDSEKDRGNNDNPIENDLTSKSASEVPVHLLGRGDQ